MTFGSAKVNMKSVTPFLLLLAVLPYIARSQYYRGGYAQRCSCVPIRQCNSYDIVSWNGGNSYLSNEVYYTPSYNRQRDRNSNYYSSQNYYSQYNGGNGRPNYGHVGNGIDPRTKLEGSIESNATDFDVNVTSSKVIFRNTREVSDDSSGNRTRVTRQTPRVINGGSRSGRCYDREVCCKNPAHFSQSNNNYYSPSNNNNNYYPPSNNNNYYPPSQNNYYPPGNNNYYPPGNGNRDCGRRNSYGVNGRILTGSQSSYGTGNGEADFGEYPWQAAILRKEGRNNDVFVCGGSLIDSRHVLTAAHCIQSHRPQVLRVRLGEWDIGGESEYYPYQELNVAAVSVHPDYNSGNLFNDIAIIKLDGYVDSSRYPHISPICVPDRYNEFNGRRCIVTGWGKDAWGYEGKFQHRLQEVDLPVLSNHDCEQKLRRTKLGYNFVLHQGFMCAGGEANRDACKGDGGGPLACEYNGVWQLAGIVSWGVRCGEPDVPGVYVRVSNYQDWIRRNIGY